MKKMILFAFLATVFFACDQSEDVNPTIGKTQKVSFKLGLPKGDPVVYTKAIHDAPEYKISKLFLYEYEVIGSDVTKLLARKDVSTQLGGQVGPEYKMELEIGTADKGVRMFAFVANDDIIMSTGSSLQDLQAKLLTLQLSKNYQITGDLSMSGLATQGSSSLIAITGHDITCDVAMQRVVARIDVKNNAPGLVITSIDLTDVPTQSSVFQQNNHSAPSTATMVDHKTFTAPTDVNLQKHMKKVFYLYERKVPSEKESPRVNIKGTLKNVPVFYSIPFVSNGTPINVLRNHLYTIVLGDGTTPPEDGSILKFSIVDEDWNEITMKEVFGIIAASYTGANATFVHANKKNTFTMKDNAAHTEELNLTTQFSTHTTFTTKVVSGNSWVAASIVNGKLKLVVQKNTTGAERTASVAVNSDADATTTYNIEVVQPK